MKEKRRTAVPKPGSKFPVAHDAYRQRRLLKGAPPPKDRFRATASTNDTTPSPAELEGREGARLWHFAQERLRSRLSRRRRQNEKDQLMSMGEKKSGEGGKGGRGFRPRPRHSTGNLAQGIGPDY